MSVISIDSYTIGWNPKSKQGGVRLKLQNGQVVDVPIASAEELAAMAVILNESPVVLNTDTGAIGTPGWEPVGP